MPQRLSNFRLRLYWRSDLPELWLLTTRFRVIAPSTELDDKIRPNYSRAKFFPDSPTFGRG